MVREDPKKIAKQLEKQEDEVYGDQTISGSNPDPSSDDDIDDAMEDIIGNKPESTDPVSLADEISKDEPSRRTKPLPEEENEE